MALPTKQKQVAQLEIKFPYPLTDTQEVDNIADLINFDPAITYDKMRVFVKSEMSDYYLISGFDGGLVTHWQKLSQSVTIDLYNPNQDYIRDTLVYLGGVIYKCISDTASGTLPNPNFWLALAGEPSAKRFLLTNVSSFIFYTMDKNPVVTCVEGTFVVGVYDTDGLTKINNPVSCLIVAERRTDLPDNNGQAFEVQFYENELPFNFTGAINLS